MKLMAMLFLCAGVAFTEETSDGSPSERVRRLAQQLDDVSLNVQQTAETELISLGSGILPLLADITDQMRGEPKERLRRIQLKLEKEEKELLTQPSRLTLSGKLTLEELFQQVYKQTGNRLVDYRDRFASDHNNVQIQANCHDVPFWQALDQILDQAGLTIYNFSGKPRTLAIISHSVDNQKRAVGAHYRGLFRIEPREIVASRQLRHTDNGSLRLTLELLWEPRLVPILIDQSLAQIKATADDGSAVEVVNKQEHIQVPVQNTVSGIDLQLVFKLPNRKVKRISTVRGIFTAIIPGREQSFEFNDLPSAVGTTLTRGGVSVTLDNIRSANSIHEIRIRVRYDDISDAMSSHLNWVACNEAMLLGKNGQRLKNPNFERYLESDNEIGFAYLFPSDKPLASFAFVYRSPAGILRTSVPFELKDIELP